MKKIYMKTVAYPISSPRIPASFDGYRIAVFSDLHNCRVGGDNRYLIRAIRENRPDCILIAGDMITEEKYGANRVYYDEALRVLRALPDIAPVYYGMGNHEARWQEKNIPGRRSFPDYRREVEAMGITFLDNASALLARGRDSVRVTGLNLSPEDYSEKKSGVTARSLERLVGKRDPRRYQILLAHTPAFARAYSEWGADLALAGHYHGGVIRLPGLGGVISTSFRLFPRYDYGRYRLGRHEMIVSSGLGTHTVPIRVNNPPELVMLILKGGR